MRELKMDIKAVNKRAARRDRNQEQEFGEFMPGYMDQPKLFNHQPADEITDAAKSKIIRNMALLVGLLILQIIFFYFLIQNSINLSI